jgi:hypothetical protein
LTVTKEELRKLEISPTAPPAFVEHGGINWIQKAVDRFVLSSEFLNLPKWVEMQK